MDSVPLVDYIINCFNPNEDINPGSVWTYPTAAGTSGGDINSDDYREARSSLLGSAMSSYSEFQTNYFYQDQWGMNPMLKNESQSVPSDSIVDGLSLVGNNKIYQIQFENPFASDSTNNYGGSSGIIVFYTFGMTMRNMMIDSNGLHWA